MSGRYKLYLMLAIACFGLLLSEAYVIGQPINSIDVDGEIAKIRSGEYSKIALPEEGRADNDEIVTYEFRNETERKLLAILKGRDKRALIVEPDSSASTDVRPGSYEVAVRGWADDEHSVKPWYTILSSASGMLYGLKFSAVTVYPCSITAGQDHSIPGRPVIFRGSVDSRVLNEYELEQAEYRFFFGDGTVRDWSKEASADHAYSRPGIYEAALEVRSGDKNYTSRRVIITIDRERIAVSLRARPVEPNTGQVVVLSAVPEGDTEGIEYKFDFGDGRVKDWSSEARTEHVYSLPGRYTPYVIARIGGRTFQSGRIAINVERMPIGVSLGATPVEPETGQAVVFSAVPEGDTEGFEYKFDFGDGSVKDWSSEARAEHVYSSPGRYTPYVIARIGERTLESGRIAINVERMPIALFLRAEPVKTKTDQTVIFRAIREVDVEGIEYNFDFGDGEVRDWSSEAIAKHAYGKEGEYSAYVKARLGDTVTDSSPVTIQVMMDYEVAIYARSQRAREGDKTVFRKGDEIVFGAILTPEAYGASFRFDFGDSSPTDWTIESEVKHKYTLPGEYTPHVIARIGDRMLQSGRIDINVRKSNIIFSIVKHPMFGIILILLLLLAIGLYLLSRILGHKPSLQFKPQRDPGIQRVDSDTSIQSYPEIRLRSVLEPDKDRVEIEVSSNTGEEVDS
jgi:PKD repeat protein